MGFRHVHAAHTNGNSTRWMSSRMSSFIFTRIKVVWDGISQKTLKWIGSRLLQLENADSTPQTSRNKLYHWIKAVSQCSSLFFYSRARRPQHSVSCATVHISVSTRKIFWPMRTNNDKTSAAKSRMSLKNVLHLCWIRLRSTTIKLISGKGSNVFGSLIVRAVFLRNIHISVCVWGIAESKNFMRLVDGVRRVCAFVKQNENKIR